MREMIYPHLKQRTLCGNCDCKDDSNCSKVPPVPEDLIVLDDEQEDEDDLDV